MTRAQLAKHFALIIDPFFALNQSGLTIHDVNFNEASLLKFPPCKAITMTGPKFVVVGAGPVGSLAALYAASRGIEVELYELRGGQSPSSSRMIGAKEN